MFPFDRDGLHAVPVTLIVVNRKSTLYTASSLEMLVLSLKAPPKV